MKIYKSPQFPDNLAWFQSGFADGWSKPHPYGIDGAFFAQPDLHCNCNAYFAQFPA